MMAGLHPELPTVVRERNGQTGVALPSVNAQALVVDAALSQRQSDVRLSGNRCGTVTLE